MKQQPLNGNIHDAIKEDGDLKKARKKAEVQRIDCCTH